MSYETVIGIEVHVQLSTRSKMFCGCRADVFGAAPNTLVCPVCLGLPGALPRINRQALRYGTMVALALNCRIAPYTRFYRKNYHYPDLVKGYQITMYDEPLGQHGFVDLDLGGLPRRICIERVHLEEDTGKSMHAPGRTLLDFNRSGVPLVEIVTAPDFRSLEEVQAYAQELQQLVRYLQVSSGDMEKGALRFEINVSLRPAGSDELGVKVELKNLNSLRALQRALQYEIARQQSALEAGQPLRQETCGWDEEREETFVQRSKEASSDYRYFPDPDLPPLRPAPEWVAELWAALPELPWQRRARFVAEYDLRPYDAALLTEDRAVADYFEKAAALAADPQMPGPISPQTLAHWITGELFCLLKESGQDIAQTPLRPALLVELVALVQRGAINASVAKELLPEILERGGSPRRLVQERGLARISSREQLASLVAQALAAHPQVVDEYLGAKEAALQFLIGQVMQASRGRADPHLLHELLRDQLETLRQVRSRSRPVQDGHR
ncbi:MAG: Asp-tRNA(Asn)/Glu-tRNA(Gln) amidotransferase subunit GatB [Chloroflexia bacterium]|nr:Asp-tRNA(Asn)/Glu-tRNA(Gln) amidotransferase subunit GatB [Chloroflexia bacterium]